MNKLLENISNWMQNGYKGNHLQSNAAYDPDTGAYSAIGTDPGSKIGTIRRVGKGDSFKGKKSKWRGEQTEAVTKSGKEFTSLAEWETEWRNPYIEGKEDEIKTMGQNILSTGEGEGVEGTGFKYAGDEYAFEAAASGFEEAEGARDQAIKDLEIAEEEYIAGKERAEEEYQADINKMARDKGSISSEGYSDLLASGAAESQSGYAMSGPTEERALMSSGETRNRMTELSQSKFERKVQRDDELEAIEADFDAAKDVESAAQKRFKTEEAGYKSTVDSLIATTLQTLDDTEEAIFFKGEEDTGIEDLYISSSTGRAKDLWQNISQRSAYRDTLQKVRDLRTGYDTLRSKVESGEYFESGSGGNE